MGGSGYNRVPALNGRALGVQAPACAGEEPTNLLPAKAGICFAKAWGFSPVSSFAGTIAL